ncbi:MAG: hypothetical protein AAF901_13120, partial [Bacteroidota bacterium]
MSNNKMIRDMQFNATPLKKLPLIVAVTSLFVLTSCGTSQYASYDNDGIYASSQDQPVEEVAQVDTNSNYYENYFAETSQEVSDIMGESEIFTDVDSYQSDDYVEKANDTIDYTVGRAGWGDVNDEVNITFVNNGWGWNNPWLWGPG